MLNPRVKENSPLRGMEADGKLGWKKLKVPSKQENFS